MDKDKQQEGTRARLARRVAALSGLPMVLMVMGGTAFATPTDSTGTNDLFTQAKSQISTILIPAVVAIVLVGSLFWLGVRWYQKGKNSGNK